MEHLIRILTGEQCSLVVRSLDGRTTTYFGRGVADLYRLLTTEPEVLRGAVVADKVVGRGAAALMILGGVRRVHALLISEKALSFFADSEVEVTYDQCVPMIFNRDRSGYCPVEQLTAECKTPAEALLLIADFLEK